MANRELSMYHTLYEARNFLFNMETILLNMLCFQSPFTTGKTEGY